MLTEIVNALVLQPHAVQHTAGRLCHPWVIVALAWFERRALHNDASDTVERDQVGKLQTIAKGARSRHHRVLQPQFSYLNF